MSIYCVWFDNFFEEIFAVEKQEFDQYDKLQACLKAEKNVIHFVEADSCVDAFAQYKAKQESFPASSILLN